MPETEKTNVSKNDIMVDVDTSGPEVDVLLPEEKTNEVQNEKPIDEDIEKVVETKPEPEAPVEEPIKKETVQENKDIENKQEIEEYSDGVKKRIAKLTKKMREAERQKDAAIQYAQGIKADADKTKNKLSTMEPGYMNAMEGRVKSGLQAAAAKLASAREAGDIGAEVEAQKDIAKLGLEEARVEMMKKRSAAEVKTRTVQAPTLNEAIQPQTPIDPKAEDWADKNDWFGKDNAMTYTAFDLHKKLTEEEGMDASSDEYYAEIDRRIRLDFPHKFGTTEPKVTTKPTQQVASAKRSVNPSRKTVRLTPSQVTIAKKLGVPLEEYAKQLKITEGV
jgi:hypothetical protein